MQDVSIAVHAPKQMSRKKKHKTNFELLFFANQPQRQSKLNSNS